MAELSKTAKKAMAAGDNNQPKKAAHVWTNEEMIHQIRTSRPPNANLFVGNMLFVDALLAEYDAEKARVATLEARNEELTKNLMLEQADRITTPEYSGQQEHSEIMREITHS